MGSKNELTRKDFLTLTFTLIGTTAVAARCSSSNNTSDGGVGGHGGTTGAGGTSHATGQGGAAGHGGAAGTSNGGGGGTSAASCTDPLPDMQVADTTGHTHTVMVAASTLNSTSAQTFTTSDPVTGQSTTSPHMHMITLQPADLTTLKGGGMVTVMSTVVLSHGHMFTVMCH